MLNRVTHIAKKLARPFVRRINNPGEGRIAIIGCGRSGTTYISKLFKAYGYSVGHECLERHGISSWCIVPDTAEQCWGPSSQDLKPLGIPIVHQVRHPLDVIGSISTAGEASWQFIEKFIPIDSGDSLTVKCMKYWYYWNQLAEPQAELTYRVDEIETILPELFRIGGFDASRYDTSLVRSFPKDVNRREHPCVTFAALVSEDSKLAEQIRELATRYGFFCE